MNDEMPITLKQLLVKLRFLSYTTEGTKVCFKTMTFAKSDSFIDTVLSSLFRSWYSENREGNLADIDSIVSEAIIALKTYKDTQYHTMIVDALRDASQGIAKLDETYKNYPGTRAKIRVCLDNIKLHINSVESKTTTSTTEANTTGLVVNVTNTKQETTTKTDNSPKVKSDDKKHGKTEKT